MIHAATVADRLAACLLTPGRFAGRADLQRQAESSPSALVTERLTAGPSGKLGWRGA